MPETRNQEHIEYRLGKLETDMSKFNDIFHTKVDKINDALWTLNSKVTAMLMLSGAAITLMTFLLYKVFNPK